MGGFVEYLAFMMALFPDCFFAHLPPGATVFDVAIADLMQWLSGQVMNERAHHPHFNLGAVVRRVEQAVAYLQNNEDDPTRPLVLNALVCLLDTVHQVPRSKGATQRARDGSTEPHMNEARYEEIRALYPESEDTDLFFATVHQERRYPFSGNEVWRSQNLKLQLYRLISCHVLSQPVRKDRVLVLDDGLACSEEDWAEWRACIVNEYHYEARSRFEQEVLMATELQQHALRRYMVWGGEEPVHREFPATGTGEADIKVMHYLQANIARGLRRFLVVNQDKDLIFVLLLQMQRLLREVEEGDELQVWLDTHSPGNKGDNKPYRYINMVALYKGIVALFAREFPQVRYPVETFCFLAFMRKTDFVQPLCSDCPEKRGHKECLCITDADAWNLFSELHSPNGAEYIGFGTKFARLSERRWSQELYGLMNYAVSYDCVSRQFLFQHGALQRFYYLLFQQRLMRLRHQMRLPVPLGDSRDAMGLSGMRASAIDSQELLIYAHDVAERLEAYRLHQQRGEAKLVQTLLSFKRPASEEPDVALQPPEKKFKLSSQGGRGKLLSRTFENADPVLEMEQEESKPVVVVPRVNTDADCKLAQYVSQNADRLRPLSRFPYKQYHGMPTPEALLLRLYDVELYMNYLRDGWWKGPQAADELTQRARLDDSLQVWPYEERLLEGEERTRALNSTHYVQRAGERGYDLLEVLKSNHVIHRRYCENVPLHV